MRVISLRSAMCLTLITVVASSVSAGVRGKSTKLKEVVAGSPRVAQSDADYSVNAVPVPVDANITSERVIQENNVFSPMKSGDPNCAVAAPMPVRANYVAIPVMVMPMMAPAPMPMMTGPMLPGPSCAACGSMPGGLSPASSAAYEQAFGPGLYRSGAEMGQNHFPYYSYRRPWYFPGQPSFHRSTDYVW